MTLPVCLQPGEPASLLSRYPVDLSIHWRSHIWIPLLFPDILWARYELEQTGICPAPCVHKCAGRPKDDPTTIERQTWKCIYLHPLPCGRLLTFLPHMSRKSVWNWTVSALETNCSYVKKSNTGSWNHQKKKKMSASQELYLWVEQRRENPSLLWGCTNERGTNPEATESAFRKWCHHNIISTWPTNPGEASWLPAANS